MNELITAAGGAVATVLVGGSLFARAWVGPRPVFLPDEAEPLVEQTMPIHYVVLSETELTQLLDADEVVGNDFDYCPDEQRTTFHAMRRDGSRRCWTCCCETLAGAR